MSKLRKMCGMKPLKLTLTASLLPHPPPLPHTRAHDDLNDTMDLSSIIWRNGTLDDERG